MRRAIGVGLGNQSQGASAATATSVNGSPPVPQRPSTGAAEDSMMELITLKQVAGLPETQHRLSAGVAADTVLKRASADGVRRAIGLGTGASPG